MKLVMTLLVRDEQDVIEDNILFHLDRGVDAVVAIDNGSTDGTRQILEDLSKSAPIEVMDEPGRDYDQKSWVTRSAIFARDELGADWVLNNDADEFWVAKDGSLRDVISDAGTENLLLCSRRNMIMGHDASEDQPWPKRLVYRVTTPKERPEFKDIYYGVLPCPYFYLDLPPKALVRTEFLVNVTQGNHSAVFEMPVSPIDVPVDIYHFPIRSRKQFERKVLQGGKAYERNTELPETIGWHWRRWYRQFREFGIDAALKDALPSTAALAVDLRKGDALEDQSFAELAEIAFQRTHA